MAGEWREMKLGDAIELKRGYDLPGRDRQDGPFPIVSSSGISGRHTEARAKAPGVVIGRYGTLGEVHYVTEDYWPLNTALYVRDFKGNSPRFVSYFLRSLDFGAYSDKAAVPGLNRNDLHTAQVSLPPLAEQRAIAHILGTLDDKIELNRRMSETLEAMARALFKSWFVDFDPVRAKAESRAPGVSEPFSRCFPSSFEDSAVGPIPSGWTLSTLGERVRTLSGGTPPREDTAMWGGQVPWISPKVMTGIHADEAQEHVSEDAIGNGTRLAPKETTLVMVRGMGLHEGVRVAQAREPVTFSQDVKALVPVGLQPVLLLFTLLNAQSGLLERVETSGHGTGRLPTDILLAIPVAFPEEATQRALAAPIVALNDRIALARRESRLLSSLRNTLLPKLISGELRVENAERFVEGAV